MYKELDNIKHTLEALRESLSGCSGKDSATAVARCLDALDAVRVAQETYAVDHWESYLEEKSSKPTLPKSKDGIYPRCVWCNGEIYGPAVIGYSERRYGCGAVDGCGKKIPKDYVVLTNEKKEEV